MLENLGLAFATVSILYGTFLLYDAISARDASASLRILGGAAAIAAGSVTAALVLRAKFQWRRFQRHNRRQT